jgi:hypothetical protein
MAKQNDLCAMLLLSTTIFDAWGPHSLLLQPPTPYVLPPLPISGKQQSAKLATGSLRARRLPAEACARGGRRAWRSSLAATSV